MKAIDTLFNEILLQKKDSSYKVVIIPGFIGQYPHATFKVFVNAVGRCDKQEIHVTNMCNHLKKYCTDNFAFAIYTHLQKREYKCDIYAKDNTMTTISKLRDKDLQQQIIINTSPLYCTDVSFSAGDRGSGIV